MNDIMMYVGSGMLFVSIWVMVFFVLTQQYEKANGACAIMFIGLITLIGGILL